MRSKPRCERFFKIFNDFSMANRWKIRSPYSQIPGIIPFETDGNDNLQSLKLLEDADRLAPQLPE
jgi:hypothetical protein